MEILLSATPFPYFPLNAELAASTTARFRDGNTILPRRSATGWGPSISLYLPDNTRRPCLDFMALIAALLPAFSGTNSPRLIPTSYPLPFALSDSIIVVIYAEALAASSQAAMPDVEAIAIWHS